MTGRSRLLLVDFAVYGGMGTLEVILVEKRILREQLTFELHNDAF